MSDMIEKHFMERIDTHLWVLEDYLLNPLKYTDDNDNPIPPNIIACREQLGKAKHFMRMLDKYHRVKRRLG